jgi:hypothetical protein
MDLVCQDTFIVDRHPWYPDQVRIIGRTGTGRALTVALEDWGEGIYRVVTGWASTAREKALYADETGEVLE